MLDPITGSLLILALGIALFQVFRPNARRLGDDDDVPGISGGHRYALLLLWLLVPLLGGILTRLDEAPQAYRTLPVIGAAVLLAGDAAVRSARVFGSAMADLGDARDARWLRTTSMFTLERGLVGGAKLRAFTGVPEDPPLPDGARREVLIGDASAGRRQAAFSCPFQ
mgnify:CR=1 FL=1